MGSKSSSTMLATSRNDTRDARVAGDNGALGVSSEGNVSVHMVPDEAFALGTEALREISDLARGITETSGKATDTAQLALAGALDNTQKNSRTEETQLSEQIIKIGIPAAALAFAVSQIWGK